MREIGFLDGEVVAGLGDDSQCQEGAEDAPDEGKGHITIYEFEEKENAK